MDETKDPNTDPTYFAQKSQEFMTMYSLPPFTNQEMAIEFITVSDTIAQTLKKKMIETETEYSSLTIVMFGSPVAEAFRMAFNGTWKFSEKQNRWVIALSTPKGDEIELNVFNKYEKRLQNGDEDSLSAFMQGTAKFLLDELDTVAPGTL